MDIGDTENLYAKPMSALVQFVRRKHLVEPSNTFVVELPDFRYVPIYALNGGDIDKRGETMSGDRASFEQSTEIPQSEENAPHGRVDFGVDLSRQHVDTRGIYVADPKPNPCKSFKIDNTVGSISIPAGWTEPVYAPAKPGTNVFQVQEGTSFVPPVMENSPSVKIYVGPGADRIDAQSQAAFHKIIDSKPATNGPQELTPEEFKSFAGIIAPFDGGNNQYHPMANLFPKFDVTSASTVNINGKTGVLVKGNFDTATGSTLGLARETFYFANNQGGIEQIYLSAPQDQMQKYDKKFQAAAESIQWK